MSKSTHKEPHPLSPDDQKPTHPGIILERDFMKPNGLTPASLAEKLGGKWSEIKVTAIITGQEGVSEKSAQDLAAFFGTTVEFWNQIQQQYFEWARKKREAEKGPLKPVKKVSEK
jgi:addiction module HigA family antidote